MDTQWSIFLDLDETLVFTSSIEPLRKQRNWAKVYQSFHLTSLPPGTQEFLRQVRQLAPLGIITRTPRPYAEKLVAYHQLDLRVAVAFHDTEKRKPHPDPVLKAAQLYNVTPNHSFYIGDTEDDILAAMRAHALPIGLTWDNSLSTKPERKYAVALCMNWEEILNVIKQTMNAEGDASHE
jgi:HAD superfamily hydrolase (TIGR01549 family)